jgi:metal-responsive CopG/Arc/MetJ family transcriptional regulator
MKAEVSIPDELFRQADALADHLGKSRSELYRAALTDYIARRELATVTSALHELGAVLAADRTGFVECAAHRALASAEW